MVDGWPGSWSNPTAAGSSNPGSRGPDFDPQASNLGSREPTFNPQSSNAGSRDPVFDSQNSGAPSLTSAFNHQSLSSAYHGPGLGFQSAHTGYCGPGFDPCYPYPFRGGQNFSPPWQIAHSHTVDLERRMQRLEERLEREERMSYICRERVHTMDGVLDRYRDLQSNLLSQLNTLCSELEILRDADRRVNAISLELDGIFDRIDPVLRALIMIAREASSKKIVAEFEEDFKRYLESPEGESSTDEQEQGRREREGMEQSITKRIESETGGGGGLQFGQATEQPEAALGVGHEAAGPSSLDREFLNHDFEDFTQWPELNLLNNDQPLF